MSLGEQFSGKWEFVSSDNFEEYLKAAGVGMMTRKVAANLKPTLTFTIDGDNWTMKSESTFKTVIVTFTIGQQKDDKTGDGRDVSNLWTIEGDKLVQMETGKNGGKSSRFERWIENGQLVIVCECEGVKCKRVYGR